MAKPHIRMPEFQATEYAMPFLFDLIQFLERGMKRIGRIKAFCDGLSYGPGQGLIISDPEIRPDLHALCLDVGRVSRMLTNSGKAGTVYHKYSLERVRFFKHLFGALHLTQLHSRAARNAFEHFEERIDKASFEADAEAAKANLFRPYGYGMVLTSLDVLRNIGIDPDHALLIDVFVTEEKKFFYFDGVLDVNRLEAELYDMRRTLIGQISEQRYMQLQNGGAMRAARDAATGKARLNLRRTQPRIGSVP